MAWIGAIGTGEILVLRARLAVLIMISSAPPAIFTPGSSVYASALAFVEQRTHVDLKDLTPELVRASIEAQLDRLRSLGFEVESCLVRDDDSVDMMVAGCLARRDFDCIVIGAGLRAAPQPPLFERHVNLIHAKAPRSTICFNTTPTDTTEAVKRWVQRLSRTGVTPTYTET